MGIVSPMHGYYMVIIILLPTCPEAHPQVLGNPLYSGIIKKAFVMDGKNWIL